MASVSEEVAALRGTRSATLRDLLRSPKFSRLLAAMTVSSLGDWIGFVAVTALVARLAGSQRVALGAVAAVMTARMLPALIFGPFAGAIVDRLDRKQLMITADIGRGLMYASMPFVGHLWAIFVISFFIECLSLLWTPARDASLPHLVPRRQLPNANSLSLLTTYGTLPIGGAIATVLAGASDVLGAAVPYFSTHPESLALWLDAGSFGFSAFMVSGIALAPIKSRTGKGLEFRKVGKDILDGVRFLSRDPLISTMTLGIVMAFGAVGAVLSLGPVFAADTLKASTAGWPILVTAFGLGMAGGMVSVNLFAKRLDQDLLFAGSMVGAAGALFVLAVTPNIASAALITVGVGGFCGTMWVTGYTLLQENVSDEMRGRTFGSITVVARLALFLALTTFPSLAAIIGPRVIRVGAADIDLSGTRIALAVAGVGALMGGGTTWRRLRRLRVLKPKPLGLVPKLIRPPSTGLFIAFEGVEGAGKGTQIELLRSYLEQRGQDVLVTREPGGTPLGERVRELILDPDTGRVEPRTEALLFAASRAQHVSTVLRPALAEGRTVICDRYIDSSLAYQGTGRGIGEQDILSLNVWGTQGLFPDLVLLLHLEPEIGLERQRLKDAPADRIEAEGTAFLDRVADAFLKIAEEHPERFVVIDAGREADEVFVDVRDAAERLLRERLEDGEVKAIPSHEVRPLSSDERATADPASDATEPVVMPDPSDSETEPIDPVGREGGS
ncbi:MAG: dTMP kinase [Actinomycetota bacterium]